jgi:hypothetical protein
MVQAQFEQTPTVRVRNIPALNALGFAICRRSTVTETVWVNAE